MTLSPTPPQREPEVAVRRIDALFFAGGATFVITEPGHYVLSDHVTWRTGDPDARAIVIAADDVVLDLGGKTLRQADPPAPRTSQGSAGGRLEANDVVSGNAGIWAEGRRNIVIRHGTVADVQGVGIVLKDCHEVQLVEVTARGCGGRGVVDTTFLYRNGGIFVMGSRLPDGSVRYSQGVRLERCTCEGNASALDRVVTLGALVLFCESVEALECAFNATSNTSPEPSGVQFNVVGLDLVVCNGVRVENCVADDNHSGGEPAGFFAWGHNVRFVRCQARRNYTVNGNRVCGFNVSDTHGLDMLDCEAHANVNANPRAAADGVKDFSAAGFRLGRKVTKGSLVRCVAVANASAGQQAPVAGFVLNSTDDVVLQECVAAGQGHIGERPTAWQGPAGFLASVVMVDEAGLPIGGHRNAFVDCVADASAGEHLPVPLPMDAAPSQGVAFLLQGQHGGVLSGCDARGYDHPPLVTASCQDMQVDSNRWQG